MLALPQVQPFRRRGAEQALAVLGRGAKLERRLRQPQRRLVRARRLLGPSARAYVEAARGAGARRTWRGVHSQRVHGRMSQQKSRSSALFSTLDDERLGCVVGANVENDDVGPAPAPLPSRRRFEDEDVEEDDIKDDWEEEDEEPPKPAPAPEPKKRLSVKQKIAEKEAQRQQNTVRL